MPMNPIRRTYAASTSGAQAAISIDWRDSPNGLAYEVQFNSGASGSVTVDTTLDNVNDGSITADWIASSAITSDTRGSIGGPIQFIRLTIGSLSGGSLTFKLLEGAPGGDGGGGSTGPGSDVDLISVGGSAIAIGPQTPAASLPVVSAAFSYSRKTGDGQVKNAAGAIHTVTFSPTGAVTAGVATIYDSLTETGDIVMSVALPVTTFTPFSVVLDAACATGIFVGFDATLANVQVTVTYR